MSKKSHRLWMGMALVLLFGASASAHHGNSAYDETVRVTIKGVVTEFVWTNPHCQVYLDVTDKNGKVVHWAVETNSPAILMRAGWTRRSVKYGDQLTIILCPAKNGAPVAYMGSGDPGTKVIFADGHELDFTDKTPQ
jgi:Family of unknown function (DUF6152)